MEAFPPPAEVSGADWDVVENELGVRLPPAYKALCDAYGDSSIGGEFRLLAPQAKRKPARFPAVALAESASLREQREEDLQDPDFTPTPDLREWRFFPELGGLLPWARDGGLFFFFETDPAAEPDAWPIVAPDPGDFAVFPDTDAVAFLARLLKERVGDVAPPVRSDRDVETADIGSDAGSGRVATVQESWARIEALLASDHPEARAGLRAGAEEAAIAEAEAELGARLPEPYRRSVLCHDGQDPRAPWLIDGGQLCSLEDLLHEWREWTRMLSSGELDGFAADADPDPGLRDDQWWRRGWIPFVAQDGDHLVLDLDPAPDGQSGQVFAFSHEVGPGRLAAPDFAAWLQTWAEELGTGIVRPGESPYGDEDDDDDEDEDEDEEDLAPSRTWPR